MNLFATVLTYPAPSANYRGESELNRTVIQKVTDGRFDYPIFSPESMRNALREILRGYGLPSNRERLHDETQLAVRFAEYPNPDKFADDFFFGYLVAAKPEERKKIFKQVNRPDFTFKRDSILRMNLAKALDPYRHNAVFTQSPQFAEGNPWKVGSGESAGNSALLHRETVVAGFQYPFALNIEDCTSYAPDDKGQRKLHPHGRAWTRKLLKAIGELNDVAGNHARSYFEFAPASIIVRLTNSLVAGYQTYCFKADGTAPDVLNDILLDYYPGKEFYVGGEIVKRNPPHGLAPDVQSALKAKGVTLDGDPRRLLATVSDTALGKE